MTFTQIIKDIFTKKEKKAVDNSPRGNKGKFKAFLAKLPGGFMLPISVMSVAGLFMGIGAAISNTSASTFGLFLSGIGSPIFNAMPILFAVAIIIAFTDDVGTGVFAGLVGFLVFNSIQTPFIYENPDTSGATFLGIQTSPDIQEKMKSIIGTNLGITSINSSIFGGIIVGLIVAWTYNRFYMVKLPDIISFFGGKRFVSIVSIVLMIPLAFLFLLIWPWVGLAFAYFGEYSGKIGGFDSFLFGYMGRASIPFGLGWPLSAPLTYTSAGGDILYSFNNWDGTILAINGKGSDFWNLTNGMSLNDFFINTITANGEGTFMGDRFGWLAVNGSGFENVTYQIGDQTSTEPVFDFFKSQIGMHLGRFGQGGYIPLQQFGLPAAALAMVMAAPRQRRKEALSICLPAALTSFLVGVTEPLEFTFLFLSPVLFFVFHSLMEAIAFLLMNVLDVHIVTTFSGGFVDTVIYGMIPMAKGTNFYWVYVIGIVYAPIYFIVFYWWIKHFDLKTPGRGSASKLLTKKDLKNKNNKKFSLTIQEAKLIKAMGGWENISSYNTCMTRLRYDIKNKSLVNEKALKEAGAVGVVWNGKNLQTIIGMGVEQMNTNIKKNKNIDLDLILTKEKNE